MKLLNFIKDNLAYFIPLMLGLGLLKGHWFPMEYSRLIGISVLLVMIVPIFINLEFDKGIKEFNYSKKPLIVSIIMNFLLYPMIAFTIGWLFLKDHPTMWLGLILLSLVPTGGMTISWTYFTKGNMPASITIVSVSILLSILLLPLTIPFFSNMLIASNNVNIDKLVILEKLIFVIIIPIIAGWSIRKLIINYKGRETFERLKPVNAAISAIGVLIVCFIVMSLKNTQAIFLKPQIILIAIMPVIFFYIIIFLLSHFTGKLLFNAENARSLFFCTAARYHVITLGIVLSTYQTCDFLGLITVMITLGLTLQIPALAFYAKWIIKKDHKLEKLIN